MEILESQCMGNSTSEYWKHKRFERKSILDGIRLSWFRPNSWLSFYTIKSIFFVDLFE